MTLRRAYVWPPPPFLFRGLRLDGSLHGMLVDLLSQNTGEKTGDNREKRRQWGEVPLPQSTGHHSDVTLRALFDLTRTSSLFLLPSFSSVSLS